MVYKDNPEGAYSRVNGNNDNTYHDDDVEDMSTSLEISHPMNSISDSNTIQTRNYKDICIMTCFICGMMIFGYIAGFKLGGTDSLPLLNALDFSGHTTDNNTTDSSAHMRASAASMTEATAKDIAAHKVIDNSNRFDDIPDLSKVDKKLLKFLTRSSYAREKTIQLLTDEFISDQSTDTSLSDKMEDTIEAMELVVSGKFAFVFCD